MLRFRYLHILHSVTIQSRGRRSHKCVSVSPTGERVMSQKVLEKQTIHLFTIVLILFRVTGEREILSQLTLGERWTICWTGLQSFTGRVGIDPTLPQPIPGRCEGDVLSTWMSLPGSVHQVLRFEKKNTWNLGQIPVSWVTLSNWNIIMLNNIQS